MKTNIFRSFVFLLLNLIVCAHTIAQDEGRITGTVLDEHNEPIIGASIIIKGTSTGTITDLDGKFSLQTPEKGILVISYIGYAQQEERISGKKLYDFKLKEDALDLDEVVVIGYGTAKKRDLTGAISSVRTDKLQAEMPRSVQDLLRGNVAGLNIAMSGKAKGDGELMVRGKGTLKKDAGTPLIVVDGVIYEGALSDLNPSDIASIDVLKDASSAAVYGAKAGYGVIAIVTQRGSDKGKPVINFNSSLGFVNVANRRKILGPEGYLQYRRDYHVGKQTKESLAKYPQMYDNPMNLNGVNQLDWYNYDMKNPVANVNERELMEKWLGSRLQLQTPEMENYFAGVSTQWDDLVFHTGVQQDYSASISNRTKDGSYYWSLGWQDRESMYVGDKYTNFTSRLNLESILNKYLTVGVNLNFSSRDEGAQTADWGQARQLSPFATNNIDDPDSPYRLYPIGDNSTVNPFYANRYRDKKDLYTTVNGTMFGRLTLPLGFEYQMNFTPHLNWREEFEHKSAASEQWAREGGASKRIHHKNWNWQVDNVFRWKYEFAKKHNLEATFLVNAEKGQSWKTEANATSFQPNDYLGFHNIGAGTVPKVSSEDTYRTGSALMGRLYYSYMNKYMFTGSVRQDGYSAFGTNNKRATFPALAVAWTFTSEKFGEAMEPWMSYGKIRFSWGENGNRNIGIYDAMANLTPGITPLIDGNGNVILVSQLWVDRMANSNLKWERTNSYNIGLDFSIFKDILGGSFDWYHKDTNDLLIQRGLPPFLGTDNVNANLGQVRNRGIEISLNANILKMENLHWTANANFSLNRRKLTKLYGDMIDILDDDGNVIGKKEADDVGNKWFIGKDPDQLWGYVRDGVWQVGEEEEAKKYGNAPGDFKYLDLDGDGVMTDKDKRFQKHKTPRFRWTLRNNFRVYKDFEVSFMLYSLWGQHDTFNDAANGGFADRKNNYDYPRWTPENPTNDYARIDSKNIGDNWVSRSFIRLDNITLSYYVPQTFLKKFLVQNMRVTGTIRNVAVFTPEWKNRWDPETGEPYGRTFSFGLNFTL